MPDTAALALFLVLAAPVIGSFLGVLIDRLPRGISVVTPRSACRDCATPLAPRDLVPVLSFALNRGRCRHCGAAIPPLWLHTELIATGAAILAVILGTTPVETALIAAVLWTLWPLAVIDARHFRLPDPLTGALALWALAWALRPEGDPGLAALGAVLGAGSFLALRLGYRALRGREGLGLGDVKLMVGLGALIGPLDLALLVLIAALGTLAVAALSPGGWRASRPMPFGTALCGAGAALWLWQLSAI